MTEKVTDSEVSFTREIDQETLTNLSDGIVSLYHPTLKSFKVQLLEVLKKQEFLYDELHKENIKLAGAIFNDELQQMFLKIKIYKDKLTLIKRDMKFIHDQSKKLKARALKLEQQKQKEALFKVHKREYEEQLIGKPSKS